MRTRIVTSTILLITAVGLFTTAPSLAQGDFVRHGFEMSSRLTGWSDRTALSIKAGYNVRSVVEAGFYINRVEDDPARYTALGLSPFVAVYPLRRGGRLPYTLRLAAEYERQALSGPRITALEDREGKIGINGLVYRARGSLARHFTLRRRIIRRRVDVVPILELRYERTRADRLDLLDDAYTASLDVHFELHGSPLTSLLFAPGLHLYEGRLGGSFFFGVVAGYR